MSETNARHVVLGNGNVLISVCTTHPRTECVSLLFEPVPESHEVGEYANQRGDTSSYTPQEKDTIIHVFTLDAGLVLLERVASLVADLRGMESARKSAVTDAVTIVTALGTEDPDA